MADVLIRDVPEQVLAALERRAAANGRSLQQELLWLLASTAKEYDREATIGAADAIRERLSLTGREFSDSPELIREDRVR
jgi:plasmid stability protein